LVRRLRAIVSLGELVDLRANSAVDAWVTDSNRLVRLRAAEAALGLKQDMVPIFEQVVGTHDRYGLHAYLTALDNADLRQTLEAELQVTTRVSEEQRMYLQRVLQAGILDSDARLGTGKYRGKPGGHR